MLQRDIVLVVDDVIVVVVVVVVDSVAVDSGGGIDASERIDALEHGIRLRIGGMGYDDPPSPHPPGTKAPTCRIERPPLQSSRQEMRPDK